MKNSHSEEHPSHHNPSRIFTLVPKDGFAAWGLWGSGQTLRLGLRLARKIESWIVKVRRTLCQLLTRLKYERMNMPTHANTLKSNMEPRQLCLQDYVSIGNGHWSRFQVKFCVCVCFFPSFAVCSIQSLNPSCPLGDCIFYIFCRRKWP